MSIQSLSQRAQELTRLIDFLGDATNWLTAGTVLLAGLLLIVQIFSLRKSRELAAVQESIIKAKDDQLALDLKQKDQAIAQANQRTEELRTQNLATQQRLEEERLARIEIEERVAFRRIPEKRRSEVSARLTPFSGQAASVWFNAGDHEGALFAADIFSMLKAAEWNVFAPASKVDFATAGRLESKTVETGVIVASTGHQQSMEASDALVASLRALGFDARRSPVIEKRDVPVVIVNVEARPEGAQGDARIRKQKR